MNKKYLGMTAAALVALTLATLAEQEATKRWASNYKRQVFASEKTHTFLLKADGKTIAELKTLPGTGYEITGPGMAELNLVTGSLIATNGITLKINAGEKSVTVQANEIETVRTDH
jgi:hypothetical protein